MKKFVGLVCALVLASCTTANVKTATIGSIDPPPAGASVLLMKPDVELSLIGAVGMPEMRADWSKQGAENLDKAINSVLVGRSRTVKAYDPTLATEGRIGQVVRLHEEVSAAILTHSFGVAGPGTAVILPTKRAFDWTLGTGTSELATTEGADYALFVFARGGYASGGRVAMSVVASLAFGTYVGTGGGQQVFASIVELKTGRIIWSNVATASVNSDMRTPEGAKVLVDVLLKGAPL